MGGCAKHWQELHSPGPPSLAAEGQGWQELVANWWHWERQGSSRTGWGKLCGLVFEQRLDSLVLEGFSNPSDAVILKPGLLLGGTLAAKAVWGF